MVAVSCQGWAKNGVKCDDFNSFDLIIKAVTAPLCWRSRLLVNGFYDAATLLRFSERFVFSEGGEDVDSSSRRVLLGGGGGAAS